MTSILPAVYGLGGAVVVLTVLAGLASLVFGSPDAALAYLRGERISLYPRLVDVGMGAPGEEREAEVAVVNRTDHSIRLIGGAKDWTCQITGGLPVTIPPGEVREIIVVARMPKQTGMFTRSVALLVDDNGFRRVNLRLTGRIRKETVESAVVEERR